MPALLVIPHANLDETTAQAIAALKATAWPYPIASQLQWLRTQVDPDDLHVLAMRGNDLAGYLRVTLREAHDELRALPVVIGGVSTVVTRPNYRGKGVGQALMREATSIIRQRQRLGMLCCTDAARGFYARCGWEPAPVEAKTDTDPPQTFFRDQNLFVTSRAACPERLTIAGATF
jgi:GNAT superfamily N-acetyltransferase